jgi:hypothetical protein
MLSDSFLMFSGEKLETINMYFIYFSTFIVQPYSTRYIEY